MTTSESGRRRRSPSLVLHWFGVVSLLAWAVFGFGTAAREYGPTTRSAEGDGHEGRFSAYTLSCSRGSNCTWYGSFRPDSYGSFRPALSGRGGRAVQLRGVDADTIGGGQEVPALDVGSRDFVFAVGGSPDRGPMAGASILGLLTGGPGVVMLVFALRRTPWARWRRGVRAADLARLAENGRAAVDRLLVPDRWGPLAPPASATPIRVVRSGMRTLKWTGGLAVGVLVTAGVPVIAAAELPLDPWPEEQALLLWLLVADLLVALAMVQIIRMVVLRPRIWLADEELLIWDSVLLWKVARIRRADIAGFSRPEQDGLDLIGGDRAQFSPFRERFNLDVLFGADVHFPARRLRWGNWIWLFGWKWGGSATFRHPLRGAPYRRISVRVKDPERVTADLARWLARGRPVPAVREPGFEPAGHFFHGKQATFRGSGAETVKLKGAFPQPVVAELRAEAGGLRAFLGRSESGRGRAPAEIGQDGSAAKAVLDDGLLGGRSAGNGRYLRIEARGPWRVRLAGPEAAREFDGRVSGTGAEVLSYVGAPGIATVGGSVLATGGATYEVTLRGPDLTVRYGDGPTASAHAGGLKAGLSGRRGFILDESSIAVPAGAVLEVRAHGCEWRVEVSPLSLPPGGIALTGSGAGEVRPFDTAIQGNGASVLLYTGPSGPVRAVRQGKGVFGIHRLSSGLAPVESLVRATGDHSGSIELRTMSLLQVSGGAGRWVLAVVTG